MAYQYVDNLIGMQDLTETSTTQRHNLGRIVKGIDPTYGVGEFIYLKGVASTVVGSVVRYDEAGATTLTVASARGPVAVALSANVASQYGWYQVQGMAVAKAGTLLADKPAYVTATAGTIDDAVVAGDKIDGFVTQTADGTPSAGFCIAALNYPSLNGNG